MSKKKLLPDEFRELERFVADWALPTEEERNRKRVASSMDEVQDLYDALLPRMDAIVGYLNSHPLDHMPDYAARLLNLSLAFMEVSTAVELFGQTDVPYGFEPDRYIIHQ